MTALPAARISAFVAQALHKRIALVYDCAKINQSAGALCRQGIMATWFPMAVIIGFSALVVGAMVSANRILGPRRPSVTKGEPFECGNPPSGSAWARFSVRFYLTAILFLVFDVEVILLYPWAIAVRRFGVAGLLDAGIFIGVLLLTLIYAVWRGALDWD